MTPASTVEQVPPGSRTAPPSDPGFHAARGRAFVFSATVFWALSATLARFVFRDRHVDSLVVVELRLAIAVIVLFAILVTTRRDLLRIRRSDLTYFVVLGLFGVAAVQSTYYYSIAHLGVNVGILIQYLAPSLLVAIELIRGRWVGWSMLTAVALALGGTALLVGGVDPRTMDAGPIEWGVGFASAAAFAFYIQYSKRGLERYHPATVLFYTFLVAALFWSFHSPPWAIAAAGYGQDLWWMFIALGIFSTLVPFSLFYAGLRSLPAAEAGVIATAEPLVVIVAAAVFLGERLGPMQIVGAALVLAAALLASRERPEVPQAAVERA
ncbi:MAG: EamA family transporter [Candidatus Eisenbacteria bacterium]|nr:EamA family transporter [Candidatus Eisenbacteria bacterium]